jgi:hypothetical protein
MHAAFVLGALIVLGLVAADWIAFSRKTPAVARYGLAVGHHDEVLLIVRERFDPEGNLALPRGSAQLCMNQHAVILLPDWKRYGLKFRTAWPLNGVLYYRMLGTASPAMLVKRMPWSSAILTAIWFLTVVGGVFVYLIAYAQAGGFFSAGGAVLGIVLAILGLAVLLFGLIVVVSAYRLETKRLLVLYDEFRAALAQK